MSTSNRNNWLMLGITSILAIVFTYRWWQSEYNANVLEKEAKETPAKIVKIGTGAVKVPAYTILRYKVGNDFFEFKEAGDYSQFRLGDSVLIEYAMYDHSIARVVDPFYMQKYKYLQKEEVVR